MGAAGNSGLPHGFVPFPFASSAYMLVPVTKDEQRGYGVAAPLTDFTPTGHDRQ